MRVDWCSLVILNRLSSGLGHVGHSGRRSAEDLGIEGSQVDCWRENRRRRRGPERRAVTGSTVEGERGGGGGGG